MAYSREAVENFLYREARLADDWELDEWLTLWDDEEAVYWIPCNKDDVDPERELSIIYDNRERLGLRVQRVGTGMAWTQEPRSKLRRLVSNVEIEEREGGLLRTLSNFHLTELRVNSTQITYWIGRNEHHLLPDGDGFRIKLKKVMLINNDEEMTQLSCFI